MIVSSNFFNLKSTLECGQVFRFFKTQNGYDLISQDKLCHLITQNDAIQIIPKNPQDTDYFINYFDLNCDYQNIHDNLIAFSELKPLAPLCAGIHILRQDLLETIISFIISANNNIKRIKGIIEGLCSNFGNIIEQNYHAFPTLTQLQNISSNDFASLGAGYRSDYLYQTIQTLSSVDLLQKLKSMDYSQAVTALKGLKGIGQKVADCIALFALNHTDCYPVDTNIFQYDSIKSDSNQTDSNQTDSAQTKSQTNKKSQANKKSQTAINQIRQQAQQRYGKYSGYAQQWKFYATLIDK